MLEQGISSATLGIRNNLLNIFAADAAREKADKQWSRQQVDLRMAKQRALLKIGLSHNDADSAFGLVTVA